MSNFHQTKRNQNAEKNVFSFHQFYGQTADEMVNDILQSFCCTRSRGCASRSSASPVLVARQSGTGNVRFSPRPPLYSEKLLRSYREGRSPSPAARCRIPSHCIPLMKHIRRVMFACHKRFHSKSITTMERKFVQIMQRSSSVTLHSIERFSLFFARLALPPRRPPQNCTSRLIDTHKMLLPLSR